VKREGKIVTIRPFHYQMYAVLSPVWVITDEENEKKTEKRKIHG